jgi:hypothetical protein
MKVHSLTKWENRKVNCVFIIIKYKYTKLYIQRILEQYHAGVPPFQDFGDPIKFCGEGGL